MFRKLSNTSPETPLLFSFAPIELVPLPLSQILNQILPRGIDSHDTNVQSGPSMDDSVMGFGKTVTSQNSEK